MRLFRTNRESGVGAFSLDNIQLHVGEVARTNGPKRKGLAISGAMFGSIPLERAFPMADSDAIRLVEFLDSVLSQTLPVQFSIKINFLERARWTAREYVETWHGGGGYRGSLFYGAFIGGVVSPVTISDESARALRECIVDFYSLAA